MFEDRKRRILIYQGLWDNSAVADPDECGCEIWHDRTRWADADAIVFHLPQLRTSRFPPRKLPGQLWVAWCMESEAHYPVLARRSELAAVFDVWMTYLRDSDIWCPYFGREMISALRDPPLVKTELCPAAAFISSPYDLSGRQALLGDLMREMPIDSYGKIHRNRSLPANAPLSAKQQTIARYKFTIAFENAIGRDYVTEKFFDPLIAGSVPVYLGAPNIDDFAPGNNCFIDASRFDNPRALARHLMELAANETAYAAYLRWKYEPVRGSFLRMAEEAGHAFPRLARYLREMRPGKKADLDDQ
jgi:alpha-1,3-fucosyltransferase 10